MKRISKVLIMSVIFAFIVTIKSYAGSFGISVSPSTAEPNSTVTISITGNNATGRINLSGSNIQLNSSSVWVENNTQTVTGTITGSDGSKATITASAATNNLVDSSTADEIKGSKSATVAIKKKEVVAENKTQTQQTQQTQQTAETKKATQQSTPTKSDSNATKKNTSTTKKNDNKNENQYKVTEQNNHAEDQGTIAEFGISSLYLFGVNENGEKNEITFTPEFDINVSEYSCNVESDIKKIEIDYDANEYRDLVNAEGLDKELVAGENLIILSMKNTDGNEKIYKIVVTKPESNSDENVIVDKDNLNTAENANSENNVTNNSASKEPVYVKMPLIWFIVLQVGIIIIEIMIFVIINKKWKNKTEKSNIKEEIK